MMNSGVEELPLSTAFCWQDADTLLAGLDIKADDTCISVDATGDNALALLTRDPKRVIVVNPNRIQLACLELRIAAFKRLDHADMLVLLGAHPGLNRAELYLRCRPLLSKHSRLWWDSRINELCRGLHTLGVWERYFSFFRRYILNLVHSPAQIQELLISKDALGRSDFFSNHWDGAARRVILRSFFSRPSMNFFDPDAHFLGHHTISLARHVIDRTYHALVTQDPSQNPYLRWIITGSFGNVLPCALRPENFSLIRDRLDRLEWRCGRLGDLIMELGLGSVDRIDLGIQVEHFPPAIYHALLDRLMRVCRPGGRIIHWNLLVPREGSAAKHEQLVPQLELSRQLYASDHGFYHHSVIVEEII